MGTDIDETLRVVLPCGRDDCEAHPECGGLLTSQELGRRERGATQQVHGQPNSLVALPGLGQALVLRIDLPLELAIDVGDDDGGTCRAPEEVEGMVIADTVGIDCRLDARDRQRRVELYGAIRVREARGQKVGADGRDRVGARLQVLGVGGADAAQEAGRGDDDCAAAEAGALPLRIGSPHFFLIRAAIARASFEWADVKVHAHDHREAKRKKDRRG